ncbi:MAG: AMP-binding protein [Magnetococcales bacterium]|nr:AMP-binding protein [Magnetococcales bacterium]
MNSHSPSVPLQFHSVTTLGELLERRGALMGDQPAFAALGIDLTVSQTDSFGTLWAFAQALAERLRHSAPGQSITGHKVLVVLPPGLTFVRAIWGVWYAGAVAVPYPPPTHQAALERLRTIVQQTDSHLAITTADLSHPWPADPVLRRLHTVEPDVTFAWPQHGQPEPILPEATALIQYTSGSTTAPKGVILSHDNILKNSRLIQQSFHHTSRSRGLIWLPPYHDMGLMGGIIQPVYSGFPCTLMNPRLFLRDPLNWLRAITLTGATTSGGPNFAYELCAKIPETRIAGANLHLDSWQVAFNGSEPVSAHTMVNFADCFAPYGFHMRRFLPCYGLAEATLLVAGVNKLREPTLLYVERPLLSQNKVQITTAPSPTTRTLVSNGHPEQRVRIVHPEEERLCHHDEVGEIWVSGPSVAQGYLANSAATEGSFHASLPQDSELYLRTGDLGFLYGGELFLTGRLKDLLIVRGQNHHPEDIEMTVRSAHPAIAPWMAAAFTIENDTTAAEQLVIVQEVSKDRRHDEDDAIIEAIRSSVFSAHKLAIHEIHLVHRGSIPKTRSGKVRRGSCRDRFLQGTLLPEASWSVDAPIQRVMVTDETPQTFRNIPPPPLAGLNPTQTAKAIRHWLMTLFSEELQIPLAQLNPDSHFGLFGLDSLSTVTLSTLLSQALDVQLEETVFWDYPNFSMLSNYLSQVINRKNKSI